MDTTHGPPPFIPEAEAKLQDEAYGKRSPFGGRSVTYHCDWCQRTIDTRKPTFEQHRAWCPGPLDVTAFGYKGK